MKPARTARAALTSRVLVVVLAGDALVSLVFTVVTVAEIGLLRRVREGGFVSVAEGQANDERVRAAAVAVLVSALVAGITWLIWQHRTHADLRRLGVDGLRFTPGWAVGWWFIPIAWLWKPFEVNREAWAASAGQDGWQSRPTWPLIGAWWGVLLTSTALNVIASTVSDVAGLDTYITFDYVSIAGDLTRILAAGLAIVLVRSIDSRLRAFAEAGPPLPPRPDR